MCRKAVIPIASSSLDNVILFPKTIEYYQNELTRMLEGERYVEAARMLRFLLSCQNEEPQYKEEWQSLLGWLTETFPDSLGGGTEDDNGERPGPGEDEEEEESRTEGDLFKLHVRSKAAGDPKFAERLLDMLAPHASAEKQMLALEQLACLDRRIVGEPLRRWLTESRLHPLVQFRGLQALRAIGETGTIEIRKFGQTITLPVAETPLGYDQYPPTIRAVPARCRKVMETHDPGIADFAEETWRDFAGFLYGTTVYEELAGLDEAGEAVWAAALHRSVQETMSGGGGDESEVMELYHLAASETKHLHKAQQVIKLFATVAFPGDT